MEGDGIKMAVADWRECLKDGFQAKADSRDIVK